MVKIQICSIIVINLFFLQQVFWPSHEKSAIINGEFSCQKRRWLIIQICQKDKEKIYESIYTGKIDAAEMSFPNLINDIILTLKKQHGTMQVQKKGPDSSSGLSAD